jgi:hypothetical protein
MTADSQSNSDRPNEDSPTTKAAPTGFWRDFGRFLVHNPLWWLTPIVLIVLLLGLTIVLVPEETLPFIYTLW